MADHILEALEEVLGAPASESAISELFAKEMAKILRTLLEKGPDEIMKGKPHLFGGFYWGIISAFLNHIASRLEEIAEGDWAKTLAEDIVAEGTKDDSTVQQFPQGKPDKGD